MYIAPPDVNSNTDIENIYFRYRGSTKTKFSDKMAKWPTSVDYGHKNIQTFVNYLMIKVISLDDFNKCMHILLK